MNIKLLLAALCGVGVAAGCAGLSGGQSGARTVGFCPPDCTLTVIPAGSGWTVDKTELHVKGPNRRLFWQLPAGAEFNMHLGDGVFLKRTDSDQFSDFYPTNDPNGGQPANPHKGKLYHWRDKNDAVGTHEYGIRFHDASGTLQQVDPIIINDG